MENNKDFFFDINLINDVIDGTVDEKTATEFFEHIKGCSSCRKAYEEAVKIKEIMKEDGFLSGTEVLPGDEFTAKTMEKIREAKKPGIIRIMRLPAVKASLAAAACLVIGVFVFRSGLFGRLEGINGLADEMLDKKGVQSDSTAMPAAPDTDQYFSDEYVPEEESAYPENTGMYASGYSDDNTGDETGYNEPEEPKYDGSDQNSVRSDDSGDADLPAESSGVTVNIVNEAPYGPEYPSETETVVICDEPSEATVIEEAVCEPEEIPIETDYTGNDMSVEVSYAPIPPEEPQEEQDYFEEYPADEPEQWDGTDEPAGAETETVMPGSAPAPNANLQTKKYSPPLSDYNNAAAVNIADAVTNNQASNSYTNTIIYYGDDSEDLNWDEIVNEQYPGRFFFVGNAEYDGSVYEAYECKVSYDEDDFVYRLFGDKAYEVIYEDSSDIEVSGAYMYLVLIKIK